MGIGNDVDQMLGRPDLGVIQQLHGSKAVMWVGSLLLGLLLHCCHHPFQLCLLLLLA